MKESVKLNAFTDKAETAKENSSAKKSVKLNVVLNAIFTIMAVIFVLCCYILRKLKANTCCGEKYFTALTALYSVSIIIGIVYMILYSIFIKNRMLTSCTTLCASVYFIIICYPMSVLITNSLNYYEDLYFGTTVFETDNYTIPIESYYERCPDEPKEIEFSNNGYHCLVIDDNTYFDLINNNPLDKSRVGKDIVLDTDVYPHLYCIRVEYYESTDIINNIQILYK